MTNKTQIGCEVSMPQSFLMFVLCTSNSGNWRWADGNGVEADRCEVTVTFAEVTKIAEQREVFGDGVYKH